MILGGGDENYSNERGGFGIINLGLGCWPWTGEFNWTRLQQIQSSLNLDYQRWSIPKVRPRKNNSDRSVHVSKARLLWETVPVRSVLNFVRRVGQRFTGGLWIWTSGQNQLQSNFNLCDYLFIKIPKMNVKDTVQEKKIENRKKWTDVYDTEMTHLNYWTRRSNVLHQISVVEICV